MDTDKTNFHILLNFISSIKQEMSIKVRSSFPEVEFEGSTIYNNGVGSFSASNGDICITFSPNLVEEIEIRANNKCIYIEIELKIPSKTKTEE